MKNFLLLLTAFYAFEASCTKGNVESRNGKHRAQGIRHGKNFPTYSNHTPTAPANNSVVMIEKKEEFSIPTYSAPSQVPKPPMTKQEMKLAKLAVVAESQPKNFTFKPNDFPALGTTKLNKNN